MSKGRLIRFIVVSSALMLAVAVTLSLALTDASAQDSGGKVEAKQPHPHADYIALAAAVSIAAGMLGAGYAVGRVGAAALGAAAERPEITGRALLFVAMGEGIAVLGFVGGLVLARYMTIPG